MIALVAAALVAVYTASEEKPAEAIATAAPAPAGSTTPAPIEAETSAFKIEMTSSSTAPLPFAGPVAGEPDAQRRALPGTPAALPAVTAQLFQIKGRFEIWPMVAVSLGDAFFRMLAVGARGEFHLAERWSIGGHGLFGTSIVSAPVMVCGAGPCSDPASDRSARRPATSTCCSARS